MRKTLEASLVADAMRAMSPTSLAALRENLETMRTLSEQGESFAEQDRQFHQLLFRDLGNGMLLRLFDQFWLAFHAAAPPTRGRTPMDAYHGHAAILDAILSGDPDRARAAIQDHYIGIESRLTENSPTETPQPAETSKRVRLTGRLAPGTCSQAPAERRIHPRRRFGWRDLGCYSSTFASGIRPWPCHTNANAWRVFRVSGWPGPCTRTGR